MEEAGCHFEDCLSPCYIESSGCTSFFWNTMACIQCCKAAERINFIGRRTVSCLSRPVALGTWLSFSLSLDRVDKASMCCYWIRLAGFSHRCCERGCCVTHKIGNGCGGGRGMYGCVWRADVRGAFPCPCPSRMCAIERNAERLRPLQ